MKQSWMIIFRLNSVFIELTRYFLACVEAAKHVQALVYHSTWTPALLSGGLDKGI